MLGLLHLNKSLKPSMKVEILTKKVNDIECMFGLPPLRLKIDLQAPVFEKTDNLIQRMNRYPADKLFGLEYILSAG